MFNRAVVAVLIVLIVLPFSAPGAVCGVTDLFGTANATPHATGVPHSSPAQVDDGTALLAPPAANIASRLKISTHAERIETSVCPLSSSGASSDASWTLRTPLLPQSPGVLRI